MVLRGKPRGKFIIMDLFIKLRKLKIMLIDDDEWIRDSMRIFLELEGCNLTTCETAEEALETVKNMAFDIIIADYKLPGMNGIEFFKRIESSSDPTIKLMITANLSKLISSMATDVGIHEIIEKPLKPENIEDSLSRLLK